MKIKKVLAFFLLIPFLLGGGGKKKREFVYQGLPFPSDITIILDKSYSMTEENKSQWALTEARTIVEYASDDGTVKFIGFNSSIYTDPQGRYKLPDKEKTDKTFEFFSGQDDIAGTNIVGAVKVALKDEIKDLGIIIITDGDPDGDTKDAAKQIVKLNSERDPPAVIGVVIIKPTIGTGDEFGKIVSTGCKGDMMQIIEKKKD